MIWAVAAWGLLLHCVPLLGIIIYMVKAFHYHYNYNLGTFSPTCLVRVSSILLCLCQLVVSVGSARSKCQKLIARSGCNWPRMDPNTCQKECQNRGQIECRKECQIACQNICKIECQIERLENQILCQIECQKECQIACQNICKIECQIERLESQILCQIQ